MKAIKKSLSVATVILFVLGIIVIAYFLYNAPAVMADTLAIKELGQHTQINNIFRQISILVGVEIAIGLLAIVLLITTQSQALQAKHENATVQTLSDVYTETESKQQVALSERISAIETTLQNQATADHKVILEKILNNVCNELEACQGALYVTKQQNHKRLLELTASYAYYFAESKTISYEFGEGLIGQVAKEGRTINISTIPEGYITIVSGLGSSSPNHLIIIPLLFENSVAGILEIASFKKITKTDEEYLNGLAPILGKSLANQPHAIVNAE